MLGLLVLLLLLSIVAVRANRGPVWAMSISWAICVLPMALGVIQYDYFRTDTGIFWLSVAGIVLAFLLGSTAQCLRSPAVHRCSRPLRDQLTAVDLARTLPAARFCWWVGVAGIGALSVDFLLLEGAGLNDLAALRDTYITGHVSLLRQLASVATWACLYCYGFALFFRSRLGTRAFLRYLAPIAGFFLVALFSAGRQAALQILLTTLFIMTVQYARGDRSATGRGGKIFALALGIALIAYMGYIAIARNDAAISADKIEVLARLFAFQLAPWFDHAIGLLGIGFKTTIVEGLVYFSSSVSLFSVFLQIDFPGHTFGAMSFPFVFRQLEGITGISVLGALDDKRALLNAAGVIGAGWTTGVSSYILDFGIVGAAAFLFAQGYYSSFAWRRAVSGVGFNEAMIAVVTLMAAAYLPFVPATSDTNLLLLWLFCIADRLRQANWPGLGVVSVRPLKIPPGTTRS